MGFSAIYFRALKWQYYPHRPCVLQFLTTTRPDAEAPTSPGVVSSESVSQFVNDALMPTVSPVTRLRPEGNGAGDGAVTQSRRAGGENHSEVGPWESGSGGLQHRDGLPRNDHR